MLLKQKLKNSTTRPYLTWLFVAFFDDGHIIEQTQADKSITGAGSAFTDVLNHPAKLTHFELRNGKEAVTLDLTTGNFIVSGTPVQIHPQHFDPQKHNLTLTYFRETRAERKVTGEVQENGSVSREDIALSHYVNRYFVGWTADDKKQTSVSLAVG